MTIYMICGPVGSKLKSLAFALAQTWKKESGTLELIDEANYLEEIPESNPERFELNVARMLQVIKKATSDDVIVYGHHLFSNDMLRNTLTTGHLQREVNKEEPKYEFISKLFLETDADTLLANYIRGYTSFIKLEVLLNNYETVIKPQNELEILPFKKFADVIIPGYPKDNIIFEMLNNSSKKNLLLTKNYKGDMTQTAEDSCDVSRDKRFEDSVEERANIGFFS